MKIVCLSDLHGMLPQIPECDLLLLAGDYCPTSRREQEDWFNRYFRRWLIETRVYCTEIVGIGGNHDWGLADNIYLGKNLPWTYLHDTSTAINGLNIYGTPYQRRFFDWAFNLDEPELDKKFDSVPEGTDIILTHGPAFGIGDETIHRGALTHNNERIGSKRLLERALEINAKLVVYGHNHSGVGVYKVENTTFVNASYVNESYRPNGKSPFIVEI